MYSLELTPNEIAAKLADRHKLMRKNLRLSQEEMAERSGVSLGSLKRFENSGKISLESLLKLAHLADRLSEFEAIFQARPNLSAIEKLFTNK
jgi:transcriptional regulator with XRE-family HTH domain